MAGGKKNLLFLAGGMFELYMHRIEYVDFYDM